MDEKAIYLRGFIDGLNAFAYWKDGTMYVGTTGMTLARAIEKAKAGDLWGFSKEMKP